MEYQKAKQIAEEVLNKLQPYIIKGSVAGSVRRQKPTVRDIDIVIWPKKEFMVMENIKSILKQYGKMSMEGSQIIRVSGKDNLEIDCYLATAKSYETLLLIRTGSMAHNIKMAQTALSQGKQLKFSEGLIDKKTKKVLANTEKGIFKELGLEYLDPKDRD